MTQLITCLLMMTSAFSLFSGCDSGTETKPTVGNISSPAAGVKFLTGDDIVISWDGGAAQVDVTGSTTGAKYNSLTPTSTGAGTVTVKAPTTFSDSYTIRLQNKENDSDVSSVVVAVKAIILTEPLGDETFAQGSDVNISWRASADWITGVIIQVSTNNGDCYRMLNTAGSWNLEEDFTWTVGQEPADACQLQYPSTQVLVRIAEYHDQTSPGKFDISGTHSVN